VQISSAHTSQQNGVAERKHRYVAETMRSMMMAWKPNHVPAEFWGEAAMTAAYLCNRRPTRALENMTPYEAFFGVKPVGEIHIRDIEPERENSP
jgi:transposase InsO family protein